MPKKPPASDIDRMAGLRLRAVREAWDERGVIKQETFAAKLGVTRTALANWEGGRLPDVRAMVRLFDWLGIPLEWIYLGQLRHVDYDLAERLARAAAELGAAVGGAVSQWPMQVERRPGVEVTKAPASIPIRKRKVAFHEPNNGGLS